MTIDLIRLNILRKLLNNLLKQKAEAFNFWINSIKLIIKTLAKIFKK